MNQRRLRAPLEICLLLSSLNGLLGADWPQFLGPQRTGHTTETNLVSHWPPAGPERIWSRDVGTGYSAPSVKGTQLVIHHRVKDEEVVEALSATTGERLWLHAYPSHFVDPFGYNNGPRSSPLLTEDKCYTFGAEGILLCLDRATGKRIWTRKTAVDFNIPQAFFGVGSTPVLDSGLLHVMVGGQTDSGMAAFNPDTGETVWTSVGKKTWEGKPKTGWRGEPPVVWRDYAKQASYATPVPAVIHGQKHLLCFMRQGLVSLDPESGNVRFSFWFRARVNESVNAMNPVVKDDYILLSAAYYGIGSVLLQVQPDGKSVKEIWRNDVLEMHWSTPILHEGYLYGFSGRNEPDARLRCVELTTGRLMWERVERWRKGYSAPDKFGRGSFVMADNRLYALGEAGLLGIFEPNPEQLTELVRYQVPDLKYPCWAAPVIAHQKLYLRSESKLICYDISASDP